jgi:hypothetical protein
MKVKIIATLKPDEEDDMRQAITDGDMTWAMEINPRWESIEEIEE